MRYWEFEEDVDSAVRVGLRVIGGLVRDARLHRNLTQRQLAWTAGFAQSTISKLETGRLQGMRLRTLAAIIGVLRMNPKTQTPEATRRLPGQDQLDRDADSNAHSDDGDGHRARR